MSVIVDVILPLFGLMLCGYGMARTRLISEQGQQGVANFVFYCAIPALLFRAIAGGALEQAVDLSVVYVYFLGCLIVFAATMAVGRLVFGAGLAQQAVMAISVTFGNVVLLGIPLIYVAFGQAGVIAVTLISSFHAVILVTLATMLVELGLGTRGGIARAGAATAVSVMRNPVIVAIATGFVWRALALPLPQAATSFLNLLSGAAAPCALFAVGATLSDLRLQGDRRDIGVIAVGKLLVLPGVIWLLSRHVIVLPPVDAAVATLLAALPTGVNPFILARRYGLYVNRAASAVLVTTILAPVILAVLLAVAPPRS